MCVWFGDVGRQRAGKDGTLTRQAFCDLLLEPIRAKVEQLLEVTVVKVGRSS